MLWGVRAGTGGAPQLPAGSEASAVPHGLAAKTGGPLVALAARSNEATDENARAALAALPALLQRVDDEIAAGTIGGEQLNAADFQIAGSLRLALTSQRPAAADRFAARRQARPPRDPGLRRRHAADDPSEPGSSRCGPGRGLALARASRRGRPAGPGPRPARASARRVPSGSASSGSSSSRGTRTKRRLVTSRWGRVRRSVSSSRSPSSSRSTSSGRGLWRGASRVRPRSTSTRLQRSSSSSGSSSVRIRTAALRKSGWSRTSPTGSVS